MELICCVCKDNICQGNLSCSVCNFLCHKFCSDFVGEGYSAQICCFNCKTKTDRVEQAQCSSLPGNEEESCDDEPPVLIPEERGVKQQLNFDRKQRRSNDVARKLEAVEWARNNSITSASKKFGVDRKLIRDWMQKEDKLREQMDSPGGQKRKRLSGGGRPLLYPNIDSALAEWIKERRENNKPVSRSIIRNKALELFADTDIKVSAGWLGKFLERHIGVGVLKMRERED